MGSMSTADLSISRTYGFPVSNKEYQFMDDEHIAERAKRLSYASANEDVLFNGYSSVISGLTHRVCNERNQTGTVLTHLVGYERNEPRRNTKGLVM